MFNEEDVQKLPAPEEFREGESQLGQTPRVETGVIQFGDDWPGVFIRGDNCAWFAGCISQVLAVDFDNIILRRGLEGLMQLLADSNVHNHD